MGINGWEVDMNGGQRPDRKKTDMGWTHRELGPDLIRHAWPNFPFGWEEVLPAVYDDLLEDMLAMRESEFPEKEYTWDLKVIEVDKQNYLIPYWWPENLEKIELSPHDRVLWFQLAILDYLPNDFANIKNERTRKLLILRAIPYYHLQDRNHMLPTPNDFV